jgi:hypothetical protein
MTSENWIKLGHFSSYIGYHWKHRKTYWTISSRGNAGTPGPPSMAKTMAQLEAPIAGAWEIIM